MLDAASPHNYAFSADRSRFSRLSSPVSRSALPALGFLLLSLRPLLVAGCQSTPVQLRPAPTNVAEVVRTNVAQLVSEARGRELGAESQCITNTVFVTNVVASLTTNVVTFVWPPVYYTNLTFTPVATSVATAAGGLAPVPWGGAAASVGLGLIGSVLALVNERRRRKALG
jgi:hypothetical protein